MAYTAELMRREVYVEVAALSKDGRVSEEDYLGTRLVRFSHATFRLPRMIQTLTRMMKHSALDTLFVLSGGSTPTGIIILAFARLSKRRSGVLFYGKDILLAKRGPVGRVCLGLSILMTNGVAVNSRYTAGLLPFTPHTPVKVIYPGVDVNISQRFTGFERDFRSPHILFVGRLVRRKGADLLLTAFSQLGSYFPQARLDIVGDGPEMGTLRSLARTLNLGETVTFYGELHGLDLWQRYAEASIFVMPSRQSAFDVEGFGTVFLEAGAFGIPSIATRTGGIPEAVIDGVTGILIDADDAEKLRRAITNLLIDPQESSRLGRNAQKRAYEFSWSASTDKVLAFLGSTNARNARWKAQQTPSGDQ